MPLNPMKIALLLAACPLSACTAPEGMRYNMSPYSPSTTSLWEAYTAPIEPWWKESTALFKSRMGLKETPKPQVPNYAPAPTLSAEEQALHDLETIHMKVRRVEVVDAYKKQPDTHVATALTPADAVHQWAERIRPSGGMNTLKVIIREATIADAGTVQDGNTDANHRYDAKLTVELRLIAAGGTPIDSISTTVSQPLVMREAATEEERASMFNHLVLELIGRANAGLEPKMQANFATYIEPKKNA